MTKELAKQYLILATDSFNNNKNLEIAIAKKKYMLNQFEFIGLQAPIVQSIFSALRKQLNLDYAIKQNSSVLINICNILYEQKLREYHYIAILLLKKYKSILKFEHINFIETLITTHSWWDTIDGIAPNCVGGMFLSNEINFNHLKIWEESENIWLIRSCIIMQLFSKEKTNTEYLIYLCNKFAYHKDFFIRKAIGWSLRQYAKTNANFVKNYVENANYLSNLSKKEALKHIK